MRFTSKDLRKLWKPREDSSGEDNGQVTIVGGSSLFHGAPMLAVKAASRLVDMVFFGSPERNLESVARLNSFIWVPWENVESYIAKSDAVLIGPGLMRYRKNLPEKVFDEAGTETKMLTKYWLERFPNKQWVIDGGSLQVMNAEWIPKNAILTPNKSELEILANTSPLSFPSPNLGEGPEERYYEVGGGNAGLTKGGTGDVLAGLIAGLAAKNSPLLAAAAGTYVLKKTAEKLFLGKGYGYNADDLAESIVFPA